MLCPLFSSGNFYITSISFFFLFFNQGEGPIFSSYLPNCHSKKKYTFVLSFQLPHSMFFLFSYPVCCFYWYLRNDVKTYKPWRCKLTEVCNFIINWLLILAKMFVCPFYIEVLNLTCRCIFMGDFIANVFLMYGCLYISSSMPTW